MSGWSYLGDDPVTEATTRFIAMIEKQLKLIEVPRDPVAAEELFYRLPECRHPSFRFVRGVPDNPVRVLMQCTFCFFCKSDPEVWGPADPPLERLSPRMELDWQRIFEFRDAFLAGIHQHKPKHTDKYLTHITSEKWRGIRARVLSRCGGICEGCLTNRATEVHHMNYLTLGDELCYDLRGLCSTCHEKADELRKQARR